MADFAVPSDKWSKESVELFNRLIEMGSDWKKLYRNISTASDGSRSFLDCAVKDGKSFKYAFFLNAKLQCVKGVIEFGPYCRGPIGHVHGGAIATVLDSVTGACLSYLDSKALTAYLNVDFERPLPLNTTTLVEAKIDKIEGRKVFLSGAIKSVDGSEIYSKYSLQVLLLKGSLGREFLFI